jgi:hypothetical protein
VGENGVIRELPSDNPPPSDTENEKEEPT